VDSRIKFTPNGKRPSRLMYSDLPVVARAIISIIRKQGTAKVVSRYGLHYVQLVGRDFNLVILMEDWEKILPYIREGSFNSTIFPIGYEVCYSDPSSHYDSATLDEADKLFYERTLYILQGLFQEDYPTSDL
jgi:hypothetical protein